jgi:hypothetical protein
MNTRKWVQKTIVYALSYKLDFVTIQNSIAGSSLH